MLLAPPSDYPSFPLLRYDKGTCYLYFMDKNHPLANKQGRVLYHRHILSLKIGRWLAPGECTHHRDNNRLNNHPKNLSLMTREAHAYEHNPGINGRIHYSRCAACNQVFRRSHPTTKFCSTECAREKERRFDPTPEELLSLVWEMPTVRVAERFGVSDVAIAKRCKKYGIEKPPRGYWTKRSK